MRRGFLKFQVGKNGVNAGLIESLKISFKKNKSIRINVLKSACRDREELKVMADQISEKLKDKEHDYVHRIIGFTIVMRRAKKR